MSQTRDIQAVLDSAQRLLLIAHVEPDGDTIGSTLGLGWALRARGYTVRFACEHPVPDDLCFLPGAEEFSCRRPSDEDAILVLDTADLGRIGAPYDAQAFAAVPVINIDHHVTNTRYGSVNLIRGASSTAELVLDLLVALDLPLDSQVATCLLTGVITDTRAFRTTSTSPDTLRAAVTLMEAGAPLVEITEAVYNRRPIEVLRLWGPALSKAQLTGSVLWTEISRDLLRQSGTTAEAADGLVNWLGSIDQAEAAAVFREEEDGSVVVSLRSRPHINVAAVALLFGGGGHPQAAGCTLPGPLPTARAAVLRALQEAIVRVLETQPPTSPDAQAATTQGV
ncbi:MAG: DHH family phosphoesterase [Anaerolineae bacterium]